jgi:hypothetical protein
MFYQAPVNRRAFVRPRICGLLQPRLANPEVHAVIDDVGRGPLGAILFVKIPHHLHGVHRRGLVAVGVDEQAALAGRGVLGDLCRGYEDVDVDVTPLQLASRPGP